MSFRQCFYTVGWITWRASGLRKICATNTESFSFRRSARETNGEPADQGLPEKQLLKNSWLINASAYWPVGTKTKKSVTSLNFFLSFVVYWLPVAGLRWQRFFVQKWGKNWDWGYSQVKVNVRVRFLSIFTTAMYQKLSTERLMHYLVTSTKEEHDNFSGLIYG